MATKPLKSIKYPGLPDTYTFVQIGTEAGQAANAGTINHIADSLEAVNGDVAIESEKWEIGGIAFSGNGWEYGTNNKRIRTKEEFSYTLSAGDVIGLTDYTGKSFALGVLRTNGTYGYTGYLQDDFHVKTADVGQCVIVVRNTTEVVLSSVEELLQYVKITRANNVISDIKAELSVMDSIAGDNILTDSTKSPKTHNGITFTPIDGGYRVTGTATNTAVRDLYASTSALPSWLKKGKQYYVTYQSDNVQLIIIPNGGVSTASLVNTKSSASFVIPDDTVGITVRLLVDNGITANETVYPIITETETPNLIENQLEMITGSVFKYVEQHKSVTGKLIHVTDVNPMSLLKTVGWDGSSDITVCGKNIYRNKHGATNYTSAGVTKTFSENKGTITVTSTGATGTTVLPDYTTTLNGINWAGLFKFKLPVDHVVTFSANASRNLFVYDNCYMQISDGTNTIAVRGHDVTMLCKANTEYGIRIYTAEGFADTITFEPQIELEGFATDFEPFSGIYTENGSLVNVMSRTSNPAHVMSLGNIANVISMGEATVSLTYDLITKTNKANCKYYDTLAEVGQKPMMISIIDDDTTSATLVKLFRDTLAEIGIVGNYAVITDHVLADDALKNELLDYESEGFGMLLHASYQAGTSTDYFRPLDYRDIELVRDNMINGIRAMHTLGFISGNNWVTPYGVNDEEIQSLAKSLGFDSLICGMNSTPVIHSKTSKYNIPRYSLSDTSDNAVIKRGIDAILEYGGWILITTHANTWGDNIEFFADKIEDVVTYARNNDVKIVNFEEGFKTFFLT